MKTEVRYIVQFQRDGSWWRACEASTPSRARRAFWDYASFQPKGDDFTKLPRRMIKRTIQTTSEIVDWETLDG